MAKYKEYYKEKFLDLIFKTKDCWLYQGEVSIHGYGRYWNGNRKTMAHRFSYELFKGLLSEGMHVLHKCDNRICINPDHLYLGSQQDNMNDMVLRGRSLKGAKHPMSILDQGKVDMIRELYKSKEYSQHKLAKKFNVSRGCIGHIVRNESWVSIEMLMEDI